MKKNKKTIIIVVVILLILVFAYFARRRSQPSNPNAPTSNSSTPSLSGYTKTNCTENTVLKKWIQCDAVKSAQSKINVYRILHNISPALTVDGKFGSKTEAAFMKVLGKNSGTLKELNNTI